LCLQPRESQAGSPRNRGHRALPDESMSPRRRKHRRRSEPLELPQGTTSQCHEDQSNNTDHPLAGAKSKESAAGLHISICYPDVTPLWPAFTDVEFIPCVKKFAQSFSNELASNGELLPITDLGSFRFEAQPPLPAKVSIDAQTGIISGCPFTETSLRSQHTIVVRWADSGEVAAQCPLAFAVASPDLAAVCNAAYLGQHPPAFRVGTPQTPRILETGWQTTEPSIGAPTSGESNNMQVLSEQFARPGTPRKYLLPQRGPRSSSPSAWKQSLSFRARLRSQGTPEELLREGRLRSNVMALGPPLHERPHSSASVLRGDFRATSKSPLLMADLRLRNRLA